MSNLTYTTFGKLFHRVTPPWSSPAHSDQPAKIQNKHNKYKSTQIHINTAHKQCQTYQHHPSGQCARPLSIHRMMLQTTLGSAARGVSPLIKSLPSKMSCFFCFFGFVFCFTSSNFYFVEKVGVQSGTPAPAREVPGPFHFLVEICGNDHRDQNQSTVFPANIKQKSMHFGVFKAFAILSPSKQSTSSIVKNHQKSPNRDQ